jgi:hypothetical protein
MIRRAEGAGDESGEVVAAFGVSLLPVLVNALSASSFTALYDGS